MPSVLQWAGFLAFQRCKGIEYFAAADIQEDIKSVTEFLYCLLYY